MKVSSIRYVTIRTLPHYGEDAIPYGTEIKMIDGIAHREFWLLYCTHGERVVWLSRKDI